LINLPPTLQTHASSYFKTETQAKSVMNPTETEGDVLSSLFKTGDCRRPKSKIDLNQTQCEVPVPLFQQTIKPEHCDEISPEMLLFLSHTLQKITMVHILQKALSESPLKG
jgi:hypothetical protein